MPLTPKELRTRRLAAGMTRRQLASKLGISESIVAAWEAGEAPIDLPEAVRKVLGNGQNARPDRRA